MYYRVQYALGLEQKTEHPRVLTGIFSYATAQCYAHCVLSTISQKAGDLLIISNTTLKVKTIININ